MNNRPWTRIDASCLSSPNHVFRQQWLEQSDIGRPYPIDATGMIFPFFNAGVLTIAAASRPRESSTTGVKATESSGTTARSASTTPSAT
jgi:hypothetical protein